VCWHEQGKKKAPARDHKEPHDSRNPAYFLALWPWKCHIVAMFDACNQWFAAMRACRVSSRMKSSQAFEIIREESLRLSSSNIISKSNQGWEKKTRKSEEKKTEPWKKPIKPIKFEKTDQFGFVSVL